MATKSPTLPILIILQMFLTTSLVLAAGSGTVGDPYLVSNLTELQDMGTSLTAHFALSNDIDASATALWNDAATSTATLEGFLPIGAIFDPFTGAFDGRGYTITGLTIDRPTEYVGLFGSVFNPVSVIQNLTIENAVITGNSYVGTLIGWLTTGTVTNCAIISGSVSGIGQFYTGGLIGFNQGSVNQCYATGSISGIWHVGGLIGNNRGPMSLCYATSSVLGTYSVGGLIGENEWDVSNSYATGSISVFVSPSETFPGAGGNVGGLIGTNLGPISDCHASGTVTGLNNSVGGLIGFNQTTTVSLSYATGSVSGTGQVGGLIGANIGVVGFDFLGHVNQSYATGTVFGTNNGIGGLTGSNSGTVSQSFATGSVTGTTGVGGLSGGSTGTVDQSYAMGSVSGISLVGGLIGDTTFGSVSQSYSTGSVSGTTDVGGLIGLNQGSVNDSFWDTTTSGQAISDGGTSKTTALMQQQATFDPPWDFVNVWTITENSTYPLFIWNARSAAQSAWRLYE